MLWKSGKPAKTVRAQNRAVASWLPDRNSAFCQASTDFFKYLLGISPSNSIYPADPTSDQIANLPDCSLEIISKDQSIFAVILPENDVPEDATIITRRGKPSWICHKRYFTLDLARNGILSAALQLSTKDKSRWNTVVLTLGVKHWKSAKEQEAFSNYAIDPQHNDELICLGVLERWLRGRQEAASKQDPKRAYDLRRAAIRKRTVRLLLHLLCTYSSAQG